MNYTKSNIAKQKKSRKSTSKKVKNKTGLILLRVIIAAALICGFALASGAVGVYLGIIENAPELTAIDMQPSIYSSVIINKKTGEETKQLRGEENREYVTLDQLPQHMKDAVVAIEDKRYYSHDGVDFKGVVRALYQNIFYKESQGASTITQQLIKNSLDIDRNTITTKLQEQYLALEYEKSMVEQYGSKEAAKEKILELYINTIALGHNMNGVQMAAKYYFGKDVSQLTLSECAVIAGITQHPVKYSPISNPEESSNRRERVLDEMLELEMISEKEYDEAMSDDVYSRISASELVTVRQNNILSYYEDQLLKEVAEDLKKLNNWSYERAYWEVYNGGLQIISNEDQKMTAIMDEAFSDDSFYPPGEFEIYVEYYYTIKNNITEKVQSGMRDDTVKTEEEADAFVESVKEELLSANDEITYDIAVKTPQPQAGMVIMDYYNGEVKAIAGGRGEKVISRSFNRATEAKRQPGSVFKVLASYAPALDMGKITAATVIDDVPYVYGGTNPPYSPRNWWPGAYRGLSTVREGIRDSMNVITVKNLINTGIDACYDYLLNFGFTTLSDRDKVAAMALGGIDGVTQLELTAAFGAIANKGQYIDYAFYDKVLDHDGNVILENKSETRQVLKKTTAFILTDMMKDVITSGTGGSARFKNSSMPISGKTGTATDTKDLMFAGYTPYYVASIYMGHDMPKAMNENKRHMLLWSHIMEQIHEGLEVKSFEMPEGIVTAGICQESGKLAVSGLCDHDPRGSRVRSEYFASGTQPTESCDVHVSVTIDTSTGMKANSYCPEEVTETVIGIVRPEPYTGDGSVEDRQYELSSSSFEECDYHDMFHRDIPNSDPDVEVDEDTGLPIVNDGVNGSEYLPPQSNQTPIPGGGLIDDSRPLIDEPISLDNFFY